MTYRDARLTPVTRVEPVEYVKAGPRPKWPACPSSLTRPSQVGTGVLRRRCGHPARLAAPCSQQPLPTQHLRETAIYAARREHGLGPHSIGWALRIARETVYAVLRRTGHDRLASLHCINRETVR